MTTFDDSHLAYLLSLGFELELCKQALTLNTTLEDATEWILDPSRPPVKKLALEIPQAPQLDLSKPIASSSTLSGPSIKPIDPDKEKQEKQRQQKNFERIQQNIKKERLLEREAKKRTLLDIQQDKEKRKQKAQLPSTSTQIPSSPPQQTPEEKGAFIQFKFTNSSSVRQKFPTSTTVNDLLDFVYEKETAWNPAIIKENIALINVFPRRVYTYGDGPLDMRSAGFLPNVSLNVNITAPPQQDAQMTEEHVDETADVSEQEEDTVMEEVEGVPPQENMETVRSVWRQFGTGHQLLDPTPVVEINNEEVEANAEDVNIRRSAVLSALEQRSHNAPIQSEQHVGIERHTAPLHEICSKSVAVLLTQHTTKAQGYLQRLSDISSEVAESLLKQLIKNGKLNVSTLRKLANHCYIQNVILDSYVYCTDSLIEDLSRSNSSVSITKLSLRGCDVITDNGIRSLTGLKNLSYLDVNNCKLTDKGLKSLESLSQLNYLNLSKTKITDQGIASMVSNARFKDQLEVLILDGCRRIKSPDTLIPIVNAFSQLVQLSLSDTSIQKQDTSTKLKKPLLLEQLDLSCTFITDEDIVQIVSQFHQLIDLKLGRCGELTTRGLSFLPRELKQLRCIQFPNREHELDGVLSRYKDLPLEHLDLSGFLNVTDEGALPISQMRKLRYLNLDGTKVTDEGIAMFKDLAELEKLYLDRTLLTDEGLKQLTSLSKLETLSLSCTQASNSILRILGDFEKTGFTRCLRTLNLARCPLITNKGVKYVSGMFNLTNLNLDHTGVSKTCPKYLKDLKYLKHVRLQGIEQEGDQDDQDDEEDDEAPVH